MHFKVQKLKKRLTKAGMDWGDDLNSALLMFRHFYHLVF